MHPQHLTPDEHLLFLSSRTRAMPPRNVIPDTCNAPHATSSWTREMPPTQRHPGHVERSGTRSGIQPSSRDKHARSWPFVACSASYRCARLEPDFPRIKYGAGCRDDGLGVSVISASDSSSSTIDLIAFCSGVTSEASSRA